MSDTLYLKALAYKYPNLDKAACELARLSGRLERRARTIHLMSDIHGHHTKLKHILGNGSGGVTHELFRSFSHTMSCDEMLQIEKVIQYPVAMLSLLKTHGGMYAGDTAETYRSVHPETYDSIVMTRDLSLIPTCSQSSSSSRFSRLNESWKDTLVRVAGRLIDLIRVQLIRITSVERFKSEMHPDFAPLMTELFFCRPGERFVSARVEEKQSLLVQLPVRPLRDLVLNSFLLSSMTSLYSVQRLATFIRHLTHMIRNLVVAELVVVGDLYDRGPRADLVVDEIANTRETTITWGNHDAAWMGAALGQKALIAFVLRVSCRYNNLSQLDEGYAIPLLHLQTFAVQTYGDDPCPRHTPKRSSDVRGDSIVAKMSKAISIIQYKLDAQTILRNPHWKMDNRTLLEGLDVKQGTLRVDGRQYPLLDTNFPTFNPDHPYALSKEEEALMDKYVALFKSSVRLQRHVRYIISHGCMWTVRDSHLCFHACIPVDARGEYLTFPIEGKELGGKELLDAVDRAVRRAAEEPTDANLDLFLYLWSGPVSPMFGKDKMATFERDFLATGPVHKEPKNPYYKLLDNVAFCEKLLRDFGCDTNGMIVNGHVPHQLAKGEMPVKKSGKAVVIDGAFSAAYGDQGYTMVLKPQSSFLVEHTAFKGVDAFLKGGHEQLPKVTVLRSRDHMHKAKEDAALLETISKEMNGLRQLITAYKNLSVRAVRNLNSAL